MKRRDVIFGIGDLGMIALSGQTAKGARGDYFVPPEESPHQRTFMQWPVNRRVHPDPVFLAIAQQTNAAFEPVTMLAAQDDHRGARSKLSNAVELWNIPTEDLWCRDAGPLFVVNGAGDLAISLIQFNGWRKKQVNRRDSQITSLVSERLGLSLRPAELRGEAGGVIAAEFGDGEIDQVAREALSRHFPDRDIVTLNVDPLGEMGGGIHCAIQQMPAT